MPSSAPHPVAPAADPLGRTPLDARLTSLLDAARTDPAFGTDVAATLSWARSVGTVAPRPGAGTAALWRLLAETARVDVAGARILEPLLDARAILAERTAEADAPAAVRALAEDRTTTWGVFAAEGSGLRVDARREDEGWRLTGTKPWCSLAGALDAALITAWTGEERTLFAIDLRDPGATARPGPWHARGLAGVVSAPLDLHGVAAVAIGDAGWYLRRPGFAWGGMGVAAVWWGGAQPIMDRIEAAARDERADQLAQVAAGRVAAASWAASAVLADAAIAVDAGVSGREASLLAARVRAVVAGAVRTVLETEERVLGPGPVTVDETHARRVADLGLYLRQDHADRDLARLGRLDAEARA